MVPECCLVSQADRASRDTRLDLANYFFVVGGIEVEACLGDHLPKAKPKVKLGIAFDFRELRKEQGVDGSGNFLSWFENGCLRALQVIEGGEAR